MTPRKILPALLLLALFSPSATAQGGSDTAAQQSSGQTELPPKEAQANALLVACRDGNTEALQEMLRRGYDASAANAEGVTPLMMAAYQGNQDFVQSLLEHGADKTARDKQGRNAFMHACCQENPELLKSLGLTKDNIECRDAEGWTPLMISSTLPSKEMTSLLLNAGADCKLLKKDGWDALMLAIFNDRTDNAEVLLQAGADANRLNNDGLAPIHLAAYQGFADALELLLQHGANAEQTSRNNKLNALQLAASVGRAAAVDYLQEASPESAYRQPFALDIACKGGHIAAVECLLKHWKETKEKGGMNPLDLAAANGHQELTRRLYNLGFRGSDAMGEIVRLLQSKGDNAMLQTLEQLGLRH